MRSLLGYHGTSIANSKAILAEKRFNINKSKGRQDHWLGYGVYFFNEDYLQASYWRKREFGEKHAILEVKITAPRDKILDLETRMGIEYLQDFIRGYLRENKAILEIEGKAEDGTKATHFLISQISAEEKWIVLKNFAIESMYNDSLALEIIKFKQHSKRYVTIEHDFTLRSPQICVRNHQAITDISLFKGAAGNVQSVKVKREDDLDDLFS